MRKLLVLLLSLVLMGCTLTNIKSNAPDRHNIVGLNKTIGF